MELPFLVDSPASGHDISANGPRLYALLSCTADAVIAFDMIGQMTFWNESAERIFGYSRDEALGQSYTLIGTLAVYEFQHKIFSETIKGDTHQWYDTQRRRKDGTLIDCAITTSPLIVDGKIEGLVAIVRDNTEKVRAAEVLRQSHAQLDLQTQQLAELNARLEETAKDRQHFVNMIVHDLRQPVTSAKILLHMLKQAKNSEKGEHIAALDGRLSVLADLLNELTGYNRIESGHVELTIELVSVKDLIEACVDNVRPSLVSSPVQIEVSLADNLQEVETDRAKLMHIITNLLSNAVKFTPEGQINIVTKREGSTHWSLVVEDSGVGMKAEESRRVFEAFFQDAEEKERNRGCGLGLSIAKRLVETLGGEIQFKTQFGSGSTFMTVFPCVIPGRVVSSEGSSGRQEGAIG